MMSKWIPLTACLLAATASAGDDFRMVIMDTMVITGRGVVITGQIGSGTVSKGDTVCLVSASSDSAREFTVGGIEQFRKLLDSASAGQFVGLLLDGLAKGEAAKGDVLEEEC